VRRAFLSAKTGRNGIIAPASMAKTMPYPDFACILIKPLHHTTRTTGHRSWLRSRDAVGRTALQPVQWHNGDWGLIFKKNRRGRATTAF
jgi:hypothetical protein